MIRAPRKSGWSPINFFVTSWNVFRVQNLSWIVPSSSYVCNTERFQLEKQKWRIYCCCSCLAQADAARIRCKQTNKPLRDRSSVPDTGCCRGEAPLGLYKNNPSGLEHGWLSPQMRWRLSQTSPTQRLGLGIDHLDPRWPEWGAALNCKPPKNDLSVLSSPTTAWLYMFRRGLEVN